jgi:hypothetical protein
MDAEKSTVSAINESFIIHLLWVNLTPISMSVEMGG